ncbi:MAG: hypothetical protein P8X68_11795 [Desulfobacterales bacterium]|jgi:hypothetical protein
MPKVKNGNSPKITAAAAAVLQYIKSEEEAIAMQFSSYAAEPQMPGAFQPSAQQMKPWGLSGRQTQMQMRNLMQLRTFHRR